ncbi:MAG: hypothetical protein HC944_01515 [Nanoarchaeota archaeon]|nr:hypothetical protein [Nanoarchaeota archaeon]
MLVIKSSNSSPACVLPDTKIKLLQRGWAEVEGPAKLTITTGTNAGHCIGYCAKEFTITPTNIVYSQTGHDFVSDEWLDLPEKTKVTKFSQAQWDELVGLIDFKKFNSLPDKIGCPGCADAPVEWIEISYNGKTKKIEFESADKIPQIADLITVLQEVRNTAELAITSFEECESAGNPIMESYPRQCRTPDGENFVEHIDTKIMSPESKCQKYGGVWISEQNHCDSLLTLDAFTQLSFDTQDIDSIFEKFGEPHDDIGSGIHIYVYYLDDDSQIWIGHADQIIYVRHMNSDGSLIENLFEYTH